MSYRWAEHWPSFGRASPEFGQTSPVLGRTIAPRSARQPRCSCHSHQRGTPPAPRGADGETQRRRGDECGRAYARAAHRGEETSGGVPPCRRRPAPRHLDAEKSPFPGAALSSRRAHAWPRPWQVAGQRTGRGGGEGRGAGFCALLARSGCLLPRKMARQRHSFRTIRGGRRGPADGAGIHSFALGSSLGSSLGCRSHPLHPHIDAKQITDSGKM